MPHPAVHPPRRSAVLLVASAVGAAACGLPPADGAVTSRAAGDAPDAPRRLAIGIALDPRRPGMAPLVAGVELAAAELAASPEARRRGVTFVVRRVPPTVTWS